MNKARLNVKENVNLTNTSKTYQIKTETTSKKCLKNAGLLHMKLKVYLYCAQSKISKNSKKKPKKSLSMNISGQINEEVERGRILDSIIEVLKMDARYKALASLGSERRAMVRTFIKDKHKAGPPAPITATQRIAPPKR